MPNTKYVFVTGGVTSSLGKGIISASLANLLQARGLKTTIQKFDPYINVDPASNQPLRFSSVGDTPPCFKYGTYGTTRNTSLFGELVKGGKYMWYIH